MANFLQPFLPHPLIPGGHLQTILGKVFHHPANKNIRTEDLYIELADGDKVFFKIDHPSQPDPSTPIIALFHGLAGSSESNYNLRLAKRLTDLGYRVARYNHRGCGTGAKFLAKKIYHSGSSDDVFAALQVLGEKFKEAPILPIGFSLSGTILLNLLGRKPDVGSIIANLKAAAAICPPMDLEEASLSFERSDNIIYNRYFTRYLINRVHERSKTFPEIEKTNFSKSPNLRDFDAEFTAVHGGFADRLDYYTKCSPKLVTKNIQLPTLIIGAADDPVVAPHTYPLAELSKSVTLRVEKSGGHMGFISRKRTRFGDFRWLDEAIILWAQSNT